MTQTKQQIVMIPAVVGDGTVRTIPKRFVMTGGIMTIMAYPTVRTQCVAEHGSVTTSSHIVTGVTCSTVQTVALVTATRIIQAVIATVLAVTILTP